MRLAEFDKSRITTPLKNFAARRLDLAKMKMHGRGGAAHGHFDVGMISDRMYKEFTYYLGSQGLKPTNAVMANFIASGWGQERLDGLSKQFPYLAVEQAVQSPTSAPTGPTPPGASPDGANVPTSDDEVRQYLDSKWPLPSTEPAIAPVQPAAPAPVQTTSAKAPVKPKIALTAEQTHKLFVRAQKYKSAIDKLLSKPNPNPADVMELITRMAKHVAAKGDKPRWWFDDYIKQLNNNTRYRDAVPQITKIDDYLNKQE